ncbi:MAG: phosphoribosylglycinamide formyltransferase [Alphaproteobacteria bacterium]|nr:phosphoribosylglycinamide formyltransferase [Alphaproteobacteria bacterium]
MGVVGGTGRTKLKVGVLISGGGTNLQALIDACSENSFPVEICVVISNVADVKGLERAEKANIPTAVVSHKDYNSREPFEAAINEVLAQHKVKFVCLAGFMRILTDSFVRKWHDRLINIHPSLLPAFKGLHIHERVIDEGVRFTGCTVHFVRPAMDDGPIIIQAAVPVLPGDTPDILGARVLKSEHKIYPMALKLVAENKARIVGEKVVLLGTETPELALLNPCEG